MEDARENKCEDEQEPKGKKTEKGKMENLKSMKGEICMMIISRAIRH